MTETFKTKDNKLVLVDGLQARVYDVKELEAQKKDIEKRLAEAIDPSEQEMLEWAKANYPRVDYSAERAELERINQLLLEMK